MPVMDGEIKPRPLKAVSLWKMEQTGLKRLTTADSFKEISGDAVVVNNARLHNGIKLVGHDYAEGNMPVQEQSGAIKKLFHNTRTERKKKPFERNRTAGKEMKPNIRK